MTVKQKRGIRGAVMAVLVLLLAIETFDLQQSFLSARAESRTVAPDGNMDIRKVEPGFAPGRSAALEEPPEALVVRKVVEPEKTLDKQVGQTVDVIARVEVGKSPGAVPNVRMPLRKNPLPVLEPDDSSQDNDRLYLLPDPGAEQLPETVPGTEEDANKGHGNDEDGYDEDNPGRGGFGGTNSSRGESGHGGSSGSGGNSGGSGGGKGRG